MADVASSLGWWGVPLAILGGAVRVGTPLLWVSLGETVTAETIFESVESLRPTVSST